MARFSRIRSRRPRGSDDVNAARWAPVILVALHAALALLLFAPVPHMGGDSATYLSLARALLDGRGYVEVYDPAQQPHTQYPPVFPALLALALALGLKPWAGLKLFMVAFSTLAVALTYLWSRARAPRSVAFGVTAIVALSGGVALEARWVLSDVPFWAFVMLALWALDGWTDGWPRFLLGVAAVLLAFFTRTAALPLVAAVMLSLGLRRRWRELGVLLLALVPLALLWVLRGTQHGGDGYLAQFVAANFYEPAAGAAGMGDYLLRILRNAFAYLLQHLPALLFGQVAPLTQAMAVGIAACAFGGWLRLARGARITELFAPLYVLLLLLWPANWASTRFMLPLLPLVLFYAACFLLHALRNSARGPRLAAAALGAVLLVALPATAAVVRVAIVCNGEFSGGDRYACMDPEEREFLRLAEWSRARLPDTAVVVSRKPTIFYAYSGRRSRMYPLSADPADFFAAAERAGARYVVLDYVDKLGAHYLQPVLLARPASFCIVRISGRSVLLGIAPAPAARPAPPPSERRLDLQLCDSTYYAPRNAAAARTPLD